MTNKKIKNRLRTARALIDQPEQMERRERFDAATLKGERSGDGAGYLWYLAALLERSLDACRSF